MYSIVHLKIYFVFRHTLVFSVINFLENIYIFSFCWYIKNTFLASTIILNTIVSSFNSNVTLLVIGGDLIVLYLYIYSIQSALKARQAAQVEVFCWSHGTFVYIDKFMRAITNKCQIYYLYHLNPCYKDLNGYKLWAICVYTRRIRKIKCIIYNQAIKNRSW